MKQETKLQRWIPSALLGLILACSPNICLIDSLLPIRADLLRGDLRALYLGWLLGVQSENVDDDQPEPPVPAGLRDLSAALRSLTQFLDIETDLLEVAAELSADRELAAP